MTKCIKLSHPFSISFWYTIVNERYQIHERLHYDVTQAETGRKFNFQINCAIFAHCENCVTLSMWFIAQARAQLRYSQQTRSNTKTRTSTQFSYVIGKKAIQFILQLLSIFCIYIIFVMNIHFPSILFIILLGLFVFSVKLW